MLAPGGFDVEVAHTAHAGSGAFELFDPDVAILDISLGRGVSGVDLAHLASSSYPGVGPLSNLTRTQMEVLHLLAQGYSTSEVARRRGRSISAIEKMLTSTYQRLNIDTASQLHARVEAARTCSSVAVVPDRPELDEIH